MHTEYVSVRLGVLALLAEAPSHGYQLKGDFEARTGGVWTINIGQIYTVLERLEKDGLAAPIEDADTTDRRPWAITTEGRKVVDAWFAQGTAQPAPARDEMLIKVLVAFGRSRDAALGVIDVQRTALYRQLQTERAAVVDPDDVAARVMAEAVRARHEADLAWLDRCEALATSALPATFQPPSSQPQADLLRKDDA